MASTSPDPLLNHIRRLLQEQTLAEATDAQLLARFMQSQDEPAFSELVRRHGPRVLSVARGVLGHVEDAEDVFQATFLILARKAGTIRNRAGLSSWLYGVSLRLARKARVSLARRRHREQQAAIRRQRETRDPSSETELRQLLDMELGRLPEALRMPLLLCGLEGQTQEQAAEHLGWRPRTLKARLQRGREVLRRRLAGLGLPATALAAILAPPDAAVPEALAGSTVRLALLFARQPGGEKAVTSALLGLVEGGLQGMFWSKARVAAAMVLVLGLLGSGLLLSQASKPPALDTPEKPVPRAGKDLYGDALPPGATVRLGTVRFRQSGPFNVGLSFTPDGKRIVVVGEQVPIQVWDSRTGEKVREIAVGGLVARGFALSADGTSVAVGGFIPGEGNRPAEHVIRIIELGAGKIVRSFSGEKLNLDSCSLAFTPDGKLLAAMGRDGWARFIEISSGLELLRQQFPPDILGQIALSPNGSVLAVACGPNRHKMFLWRWQAGEEPRELASGWDSAHSLSFSPDGKTLATGSDKNSGVRLWDVASGRLVRTLGNNGDWDRWSVRFSPDGCFLAAASNQQKALILFDAATGQEVRRLANLYSPAFSPDGKRVAGTYNNAIQVRETATGKDLTLGDVGHCEPPNFVALRPDGTALTASDDGSVRFWDSATGRPLRTIAVAGEWVRAAALSPDGRWLATSTLGQHDAVSLWNVQTGKQVYRLAGHGRFGGRRALVFTPDSKRFLSWGDDMYLRVWDVATGKALAEHEIRPDGKPIPTEDEENDPPNAAGLGVFTADARTLIVEQRGYFVFDTATGQQTQKIRNEDGHILGLAVSPDHKCLLTSATGRTQRIRLTDGTIRVSVVQNFVRLREITTGKQAWRLELPRNAAAPVAFAPDGKTCAVGDDRPPRSILLLDTATGAQRGKIEGCPGRIHALAFSPDGRRLIVGLSDTTAVIWDVARASAGK